MTTIREQVLAAFETAIQAGLAADVPAARFERNLDIEPSTFPTVIMVDGGQDVDFEDQVGVKVVTLNLEVEMWAVASSSDGLAGALDQLYESAVKAALADITLGGLAANVEEGAMTDPVIDRGEGRGPTIATSVAFSVTYWTDVTDPSQTMP